MRRLASPWLLLAWTVLAPAARAVAQGCAMCGGSFAPNDPATKAINTSVIFLLLMPYTMLAAVSGWLYLRYRRTSSRRRTTVTTLPWVRAGASSAPTPEEE